MRLTPRDLPKLRDGLAAGYEADAPGVGASDLWWLSADACSFLESLLGAGDLPPLPELEGLYWPRLVAFAKPLPGSGGRYPAKAIVLQMDAATLPLALSDSDDGEERAEDDSTMLPGFARLIAWAINNPDLVERREVDASPSRPSKAARRRGARHEPSPVTIVDLRAPVKRARAEVAEAERTYRHRWIVRGHWHTYCTGKGRTERRVVYVMPYVKGPADAPLNRTELVHKV